MNAEKPYPGTGKGEHELCKAYNGVIDAGTIFFWDRKGIGGVSPEEVVTLYKRAFHSHRKGEFLGAERWARSAKHLAYAFRCEAKIAYLEPRASELPFLKGASAEDFDLKEHSDTAEDLLNSLSAHMPDLSAQSLPSNFASRYLTRARKHIEVLRRADYRHELLRAERIKAAYEYGRVIECLTLACEEETDGRPRSAA